MERLLVIARGVKHLLHRGSEKEAAKLVYCSVVETPMPPPDKSTVLTLRVPPDLERRIEREARRRKRSKSAVLREVLQIAFSGSPPPDDPAREARRQSLLVSGRASERETIEFVEHAADDEGWR
jgi:hypothetical protein